MCDSARHNNRFTACGEMVCSSPVYERWSSWSSWYQQRQYQLITINLPSSSLDDYDHHHQDHPHDPWSLRSSHSLRRRLAEHHNYTDPIILNNTDTEHFMVSIVYFAYINTKRENWLKLILSQVYRLTRDASIILLQFPIHLPIYLYLMPNNLSIYACILSINLYICIYLSVTVIAGWYEL